MTHADEFVVRLKSQRAVTSELCRRHWRGGRSLRRGLPEQSRLCIRTTTVPAFRRPVVRQPVVRRPVVRQPAARLSAFRRPVARQPVVRRPVVRRAVVHRPVIRRSSVRRTVARRLVVCRSVALRPVARRPAIVGKGLSRETSCPHPSSGKTGGLLTHAYYNP